MDGSVEIAPVTPPEATQILPDLICLLQDAVDAGASVGFLVPLASEEAGAYWRGRIEDVAAGRAVMLVARAHGRIVGSVQLAFATQQNGGHRAEVQRLIVLRSSQRQGIGAALMHAVEREARSHDRTLLLLNTRAGDAPEAFYIRLGYTPFGTVPRFALSPDGTFNTTTFMYRQL